MDLFTADSRPPIATLSGGYRRWLVRIAHDAPLHSFGVPCPRNRLIVSFV